MSRNSIPAIFREQVNALRSRPMVYSKRDSHWRPLTWAQMGERVSAAAAGLCALGVSVGERVAIYAASCVEWVLADLAALSAGAVDVPIPETALAETVGYIVRDAEAVLVFVGEPDLLDVLLRAQEGTHLGTIILLYEPTEPVVVPGVRVLSLLELERLGREGESEAAVTARIEAITADDLLTLIYTSGTTGVPKGVMITHGNMIANCTAVARAVPIRADDVLLSFLPLSHSFERMAGYYLPSLFGGAAIYYAESLGRLIQNIEEVRPTVLTGVPRIYEKIYARFFARRAQAHPTKRFLLDQAITTGLKVSRLRQQGRPPGPLLALPYKIAYDQVFGPLTERLGGRIRFLVSGGAALSAEIAEFFLAAGILILEGYGLSEASCVVSVNRPDRYRFGTVGVALDNVRMRIADDGEILVKGPSVTKGYWHLEAETAALLDEDGWLATGDIGHLERDGFLRITDRKKDLFKGSSGKYVAPQYIERLLCSSPFIAQSCVVGDRRPYCVALVVPAEDALAAWAREKGIETDSLSELLGHPKVRHKLRREIGHVNGKLERHETVRAFHMLDQPFAQANGLLTPSLKVKRRQVFRRYALHIDRLYAAGTNRRGWRPRASS